MIDFSDIYNGASCWIDDNLHYLKKESKSEAEYYQVLLYNKNKVNYLTALKYMYDFYLSEQSVEEKIKWLSNNNFPNYRISEVLAIDSLYNKKIINGKYYNHILIAFYIN